MTLQQQLLQHFKEPIRAGGVINAWRLKFRWSHSESQQAFDSLVRDGLLTNTLDKWRLTAAGKIRSGFCPECSQDETKEMTL